VCGARQERGDWSSESGGFQAEFSVRLMLDECLHGSEALEGRCHGAQLDGIDEEVSRRQHAGSKVSFQFLYLVFARTPLAGPLHRIRRRKSQSVEGALTFLPSKRDTPSFLSWALG